MNLERTPICNALDLGRTRITNGTDTQLDNIHIDAFNQAKPTLIKGNRCGHNKNKIKVSPVFGETKLRRRRPHVIEEFGRRVRFVALRLRTGISRRDYEGNQDKPLGALSWYLSLYESDGFRGFLHHLHHNKKNRRRRSECVEATLFLVLATLVFGCNLHEMAYGYHDGANRFHYFDYAKLGKDCMVTESRVKRAMKLLKELELVTVTPYYKTLPTGKIITEYTKIELNEEIFNIFGLHDEYLKDREKSTIKFYKKQERLDHNKARRSFYSQKRKFGTSSKPRNIKEVLSSSHTDIKTLSKTVIKSMAPQYDNNHGREVRDRIRRLIDRGMSVKDAMAAASKQTYPPPNLN